ncbi:MAG: type I-C CRISPR-associated protein Cas5 [Elusimicrobia bacterium]|nr:type I-C CRISPR-associated protein Cas5 [Elusimicrobiota bacterium]
MDSPMFSVHVGGDIACFTRPELKVERVSYEVITPSAARGVLEAILWKPAISWTIKRIHVLKEIRWMSFKRNEVTRKLAVTSAKSAMKRGVQMEPLFVDEDRAQRHTLALRDVEYIIEAGFQMTAKAGPEDNPVKFEEMFRRRLEKGQCYRTPYLGCREFAAWFKPHAGPIAAINETRDLGWMLYDIEFGDKNKPHFFHAEIKHGVVEVAPPDSWPAEEAKSR